ncbi:MAG: polysaccharide deacetylase family protein [Rhodothermales bacterium]|nr:polysaccharide deacetylase family protein [Rhodothermales bacterium]
MTASLPVLTFHAFDERPSPISYPPPLFRRAVAALHGGGWRTVRLSEAARLLAAGAPPPEKTLAITIDDGYRSTLDVALPALREHGLTATVFVVTDRPAMHGRPLMTPPEWRLLHENGLELGAHTRSHPMLPTLGDADVEREVLGSKLRIEDAVGAAVPAFAYPAGRFDERVRGIVAPHFACACSTRLAMARPGGDPYALPRLDAHYLRHERAFPRLDGALLRGYLAGRAALRALRRLPPAG